MYYRESVDSLCRDETDVWHAIRNKNRSPYYLREIHYLLQQIRMALFATANKDEISYLLQQVNMTLFATANKYDIMVL